MTKVKTLCSQLHIRNCYIQNDGYVGYLETLFTKSFKKNEADQILDCTHLFLNSENTLYPYVKNTEAGQINRPRKRFSTQQTALNPLIISILNNNLEGIVYFLYDRKVPIIAKYYPPSTVEVNLAELDAFKIAISQNKPKILECFIARVRELQLDDYLSYAIKEKKFESAKFLLQIGAIFNIESSKNFYSLIDHPELQKFKDKILQKKINPQQYLRNLQTFAQANYYTDYSYVAKDFFKSLPATAAVSFLLVNYCNSSFFEHVEINDKTILAALLVSTIALSAAYTAISEQERQGGEPGAIVNGINFAISAFKPIKSTIQH